jgi:hypothetical protein
MDHRRFRPLGGAALLLGLASLAVLTINNPGDNAGQPVVSTATARFRRQR